MKKKVISCLLAAVMAASMAACGGQESAEQGETIPEPAGPLPREAVPKLPGTAQRQKPGGGYPDRRI